jgi:hypothetical protein
MLMKLCNNANTNDVNAWTENETSFYFLHPIDGVMQFVSFYFESREVSTSLSRMNWNGKKYVWARSWNIFSLSSHVYTNVLQYLRSYWNYFQRSSLLTQMFQFRISFDVSVYQKLLFAIYATMENNDNYSLLCVCVANSDKN